ncbi:hypothetical protein [Chitinophaga jiangningensis]|nr:hypothetical protein [Chitinophaga jiangningensis]
MPCLKGKDVEYFKSQLRKQKPMTPERLKRIQETKAFFDSIRQ